MVIEIPDSVFKDLPQYSKPELVKIDFAVWLYQKEVLTLAQAASLCGQTRLQFQKTLKSKGVYLNFDSNDLKTDLENI